MTMAKTYIDGEGLTLRQLSEKYDILYSTLSSRINENPTKDISELL